MWKKFIKWSSEIDVKNRYDAAKELNMVLFLPLEERRFLTAIRIGTYATSTTTIYICKNYIET